jgi:hypothetical protein
MCKLTASIVAAIALFVCGCADKTITHPRTAVHADRGLALSEKRMSINYAQVDKGSGDTLSPGQIELFKESERRSRR